MGNKLHIRVYMHVCALMNEPNKFFLPHYEGVQWKKGGESIGKFVYNRLSRNFLNAITKAFAKDFVYISIFFVFEF